MSDEIITLNAQINNHALRSLVKECVRELLHPLLQSIGGAGPLIPQPPAFSPLPPPLGGDPPPLGAKKVARARKTAGTPKPAAGAKVATRDPMTSILETVKSHPAGITGENLRALLGWEKGLYHYHMKRAMADKLLKRKGEKRATTYFPNDRAIEKHEAANGIAESEPVATN